MRKYLVVYEKTKTGYSAYVPDLPGVIATGKTKIREQKFWQMSSAGSFVGPGSFVVQGSFVVPAGSYRVTDSFSIYNSSCGFEEL